MVGRKVCLFDVRCGGGRVCVLLVVGCVGGRVGVGASVNVCCGIENGSVSLYVSGGIDGLREWLWLMVVFFFLSGVDGCGGGDISD